MDRIGLLDRFYELLKRLEESVGGKRRLKACHGKMGWPLQGVYFFFEEGEFRQDSNELRVTRVGTHAVSTGSKSTLWQRLLAHRGRFGGSRPGGGNHRGSVFRLHVGSAIIRRDGLVAQFPDWAKGSSAKEEIRVREYPLEKLVSQQIQSMPFLWLEVKGPASPDNLRAYVEQNAIALLSNFGLLKTGSAIDPPSSKWLGYYSAKKEIRESGLWNVEHVQLRKSDSLFLKKIEALIEKIEGRRLIS